MSDNAIQAAADLAHRPDSVLLVTTEHVPGHVIREVLGLVRGNTIRTRHIGHDITAVFKSIVGGEISEYTKMIAESREQALDRLRAECVARGGNAVVGLRITTSMVMQGSSEILAYGTAVTLAKDDQPS